MNRTPYEIEWIEVGILKKEEVASIRISRERFIELVTETFYDGGYKGSVQDKLMPVALTMPRFPLQAWLTYDRGCGCVVGEYLVATSEIDRFNLSRLIYTGRKGQMATVEELLAQDPDGIELARFGGDIDDTMKQEIFRCGLTNDYISMYSPEDVTRYVRSVEIID